MKPLFPVILMILLIGTGTGCEYEEMECADEKRFCGLVEDQDFKETGAVINEFLKTLEYNYDPADPENHDTNIKILKDWLLCKSCVDNVKIREIIITTYPPQKELEVTFIAGDGIKEKIMDISLKDTLEFNRYH